MAPLRDLGRRRPGAVSSSNSQTATGLRASGCPLSRCFLNFLAGLLDASANVMNRILNAASGALHRAAGTSTARESQHQDSQCENCFHALRIKPLGKDSTAPESGVRFRNPTELMRFAQVDRMPSQEMLCCPSLFLSGHVFLRTMADIGYPRLTE